MGVFVYHVARGKVLEKLPPTNGKPIIPFYTQSQRIFHWSSFGILLIAGLSGYYMLGTSNLGLLSFHDWTLLPVVLTLLFHVLSDGRKREMSFTLSDILNRLNRTARFTGKYDPLKRAYHMGVAISLMGLGVTGIMLWNPLRLGAIFPYFQEILVLHVLSALLLTSLATFHVYLALMPSNRPLLTAMITGLLDEAYFKAHYSFRPKLKEQGRVDEGRRTFLKSTGISVIALIMVTLFGRGSGSGSGSNQGISSSGNIQTQASYGPIGNTKQMSPNSAKLFRLPNGAPGILVELPNGQLKAYSAVCTHAGCTVGYVPGQQIILCPCHGAEFSPSNGSVLGGPAPTSLPQFPVSVDNSGNIYIGNVSSSSTTNNPGYGGDDGSYGDN